MNGGMSLGRVMPLYKGEYDPGQAYGQNDVVRLDGRVYWHTGKEKTVGVPPAEEQVWHLLLEAGAAAGEASTVPVAEAGGWDYAELPVTDAPKTAAFADGG